MLNFNEFFHDFSLKLTVELVVKLTSKILQTIAITAAGTWCCSNLQRGLRSAKCWLITLGRAIANWPLLAKRVTISFQPFFWIQKVIAFSLYTSSGPKHSGPAGSWFFWIQKAVAFSLIPLMSVVGICTTYLTISQGHPLPQALLVGGSLSISGNLLYWFLNKSI